VERNYHDVVAMYEDWHSLVGVDAAGRVVTRRIAICRHSELDQVKARPRQMSSTTVYSFISVSVE